MNLVACSYAALRFLPYRETGEFANVGVVVWCPAAKSFLFHCNHSLGKRIRGFFPDLDLTIYREAVRGVEGSLRAVEPQFTLGKAGGDEALIQRFQELVRVREGLMAFGPAGALLAESPEKAMETLYQRLVLRQFAPVEEPREVAMRRRLGECLRTWKLMEHYRQDVPVGDERFHVTVPFAHVREARPTQIIRPLDLDLKDSTAVYRHGDLWAASLRRLRSLNLLPQRIVIPVQLPQDQGERWDAAAQIMGEFTELGAMTMPMDDQDRVREAALVA
jgi:hypothetical protein